jgi:hypothetical protein
LRFVVEGASLTLLPGPGTGEIAVAVDGDPARRVLLDGRPVRLVRDWRQKRREITLTVAGGEVGVDGIVVQSPWHPTPWLALGTAGLILAAIWGLARFIVGRRRR